MVSKSLESIKLQIVAAQRCEQLGLRSDDNQTHIKEAGEKFCSSTRGLLLPPNQQGVVTEEEPVPLSAPQESGAGQENQ